MSERGNSVMLTVANAFVTVAWMAATLWLVVVAHSKSDRLGWVAFIGAWVALNACSLIVFSELTETQPSPEAQPKR